MSHREERVENNCLNCNAEVQGRFCHICGQENIKPKETFWHLVTHFVYDLTHFDGKFFSSVKYLLLRPGFLPKEYMIGRRTSYLNPLRFYIFTSAFFFVFFFSFVPSKEVINLNNSESYRTILNDLEKGKAALTVTLNQGNLSLKEKKEIQKQLSFIDEDLLQIKNDSTNLKGLKYNSNLSLQLGTENYANIQAYDSIQNNLPAKDRDGWLARKFKIRSIEIKGEYGNDGKKLLSELGEKFIHTFPQLLFISLPLFALILQLLYIRHKKFYYADHIIFSVYLYIAMFIMIFLQISISKLKLLPYFHWLRYATLPLVIYTVWYILKSLSVNYEQSKFKTVLKLIILFFLSTVLMGLLFMVFLIFSVFTF